MCKAISSIASFKNITTIDISCLGFENLNLVETFVFQLPKSLVIINVDSGFTEDLYKLGKHIHARTFSV